MKSLVDRLSRIVRWIAGHELSVLLALLAVVLSVWMFAEIADEVREGDSSRFDREAIRLLRRADDPSQPIGPGWLHEAGRDLTALGGFAVLTLVTASVLGFLVLTRNYGAAGLIAAATIGGYVVSTLLKWAFARERPDIVPHLSIVTSYSFPSGHSMQAAAVYLTLGTLLAQLVDRALLRVYFLGIALLLAFLVGLSRVYLGVHYPSDVLAGWSAGLGWAALCWLVARYLQSRGRVEDHIEVPADQPTL